MLCNWNIYNWPHSIYWWRNRWTWVLRETSWWAELSDKETLELENKAEAMDFDPGTLLFGGEDQMLMWVSDADESKNVRNITWSIGIPEIEERLSKV